MRFSEVKNQRILKLLHLMGTLWFALCTGFLVVFKMRQAEVHWWVIISLSGPSIVIAFLLLLVYLFAIFRGATRIEKSESEHPLSVTTYYMVFYYICPCLGGVIGVFAAAGTGETLEYVFMPAISTFFTTFIIWIIVDPMISLLEMLLPVSRNYRREHLIRIQAEKNQRSRELDGILSAFHSRQEQQKEHWNSVLFNQIQRLANLLSEENPDTSQQQAEAVDIGVDAWRLGGIHCMRWLRDRALDVYREQGCVEPSDEDVISFWWDGIGDWRDQSYRVKDQLTTV